MQTFTAKQYLEIDVATNAGLDKATWNERLQWFDANRLTLEEGSIDGLKAGLLKHSKDPALVLGGIFAYRDMLANEPIGYTIGLDATASGLQLLSVLINCPSSAALCNVVNLAGTCIDGYTAVYDECKRRGMLNQNISRKDCKYALMTHLYGSKVVPKQVFGEGQDLQLFYQVINDLLPGANALNHALLSLWNPEALEHVWTLPDGFDVRVKVTVNQEVPFQFMGNDMVAIRKINAPKESGLSIGANVIHSLDGMVVREMVRRCSYNPYRLEICMKALLNKNPGKRTTCKQDLDLLRQLDIADDSGFMSAKVIGLIDRRNAGHLTQAHKDMVMKMIESLPEHRFDLLTIHDCFRCHPNYGNDLRQQYINIMAELSESNVLSFIVSQLAGKHVPVTKIAPAMPAAIRASDYMLC